MANLILHPTAATAVPVTHIATGRTGKSKAVKAKKDITVPELRAMVKAAGLHCTTKHTKAELRLILTSGTSFKAAAQVRENAARKAKRAAKQG